MAKGKYEQWLTEEGLLKLESWARDGLTDEQIAVNMGIGYSTLQTWKSKYQDIQDTLKRGKDVIDIQVENALLKRALGYRYTEVTREKVFNAKTGEYQDIQDTLKRGKDVIDIQVENALLKRALGYRYTEVTREKVFNAKTGEFELTPTKEVTKEVAPDTTAQIFWLKNRRPEQWRDKRDVSVEGEISTNNPFRGLSTDELRKLIESEE